MYTSGCDPQSPKTEDDGTRFKKDTVRRISEQNRSDSNAGEVDVISFNTGSGTWSRGSSCGSLENGKGSIMIVLGSVCRS